MAGMILDRDDDDDHVWNVISVGNGADAERRPNTRYLTEHVFVSE